MKPLSRRTVLSHALGAAAGLAASTLHLPRTVSAEGAASVVGRTQLEAPMNVYRFGNGPMRLFIMGGQHGGPEYNTVQLARMLMDKFDSEPAFIPDRVSVWVMPEGNPDGVQTGSRQYISGVDPNRNWGGPGWAPDAADSNGRFTPGLGGPTPFSERETQATANFLWDLWPHYTINYHSVGGFMFGGGTGLDGELTTLYSDAAGYPVPGRNGSGGSPLSYRATGSMNAWMRSVGLGGTLIELASVRDPEYRRNLAGVRAVLDRLATEPSG